jgi:hypothetical protein
MIFKSEAQLRVEIDRLTEQLTAVMAANADEYLAQDIALSNAVEEVKKAYSKKDWIRLKNAASYITEIKNDVAPVFFAVSLFDFLNGIAQGNILS